MRLRVQGSTVRLQGSRFNRESGSTPDGVGANGVVDGANDDVGGGGGDGIGNVERGDQVMGLSTRFEVLPMVGAAVSEHDVIACADRLYHIWRSGNHETRGVDRGLVAHARTVP